MTYIIAEAGTGHYAQQVGNRYALAHGFIQSAAFVGADAVKFQLFTLDEPLFCPLPGDEKRVKRWNSTFLGLTDWQALKEYAESLRIDLLWSVFQPTCVEWLKELKPKYIKVASRASRTFPYDLFPDTPIIASTGMTDPQFSATWLQCSMDYPTPLERALWTSYGGLSDHSGTIWPGLDAVARGANILEVHFKIPGADMGNDEPVCLTTDQLKLLCEARDAFARMHANRI